MAFRFTPNCNCCGKDFVRYVALPAGTATGEVPANLPLPIIARANNVADSPFIAAITDTTWSPNGNGFWYAELLIDEQVISMNSSANHIYAIVSSPSTAANQFILYKIRQEDSSIVERKEFTIAVPVVDMLFHASLQLGYFDFVCANNEYTVIRYYTAVPPVDDAGSGVIDVHLSYHLRVDCPGDTIGGISAQGSWMAKEHPFWSPRTPEDLGHQDTTVTQGTDASGVPVTHTVYTDAPLRYRSIDTKFSEVEDSVFVYSKSFQYDATETIRYKVTYTQEHLDSPESVNLKNLDVSGTASRCRAVGKAAVYRYTLVENGPMTVTELHTHEESGPWLNWSRPVRNEAAQNYSGTSPYAYETGQGFSQPVTGDSFTDPGRTDSSTSGITISFPDVHEIHFPGDNFQDEDQFTISLVQPIAFSSRAGMVLSIDRLAFSHHPPELEEVVTSDSVTVTRIEMTTKPKVVHNAVPSVWVVAVGTVRPVNQSMAGFVGNAELPAYRSLRGEGTPGGMLCFSFRPKDTDELRFYVQGTAQGEGGVEYDIDTEKTLAVAPSDLLALKTMKAMEHVIIIDPAKYTKGGNTKMVAEELGCELKIGQAIVAQEADRNPYIYSPKIKKARWSEVETRGAAATEMPIAKWRCWSPDHLNFRAV